MKSSTAHKENPDRGGPDSRDRSTANSLKGVDSSSALRSTQIVAHKDNPVRGGPDSRDHSTAYPSGLTKPSDPAEGDPPKQESDHPPKTPPVPTSLSKSEKLEAKLTPIQKRRLKTLKEKGKAPKVPSSLPALDTSSPTSLHHSEPASPKSPKSPDLIISGSSSVESPSSPISTMGTVEELAGVLTDKLKDIGRHPTIPSPQFKGKKGEDPNDHCMKLKIILQCSTSLLLRIRRKDF